MIENSKEYFAKLLVNSAQSSVINPELKSYVAQIENKESRLSYLKELIAVISECILKANEGNKDYYWAFLAPDEWITIINMCALLNE